MAVTLIVKSGLSEDSKREFETREELLLYLSSLDNLPDEEIGKLVPLPEHEVTPELQAKFDRIDKMNISGFIDI